MVSAIVRLTERVIVRMHARIQALSLEGIVYISVSEALAFLINMTCGKNHNAGETGLMRNRIVSFGGAVLCVGFLPYGPFVCAGSVDKSTKVFHVLTGVVDLALN